MKRPPMLKPLVIDTSAARNSDAQQGKLEITDSMQLVLTHGSGSGQYVVTDSGVERTPNLSAAGAAAAAAAATAAAGTASGNVSGDPQQQQQQRASSCDAAQPPPEQQTNPQQQQNQPRVSAPAANRRPSVQPLDAALQQEQQQHHQQQQQSNSEFAVPTSVSDHSSRPQHHQHNHPHQPQQQHLHPPPKPFTTASIHSSTGQPTHNPNIRLHAASSPFGGGPGHAVGNDAGTPSPQGGSNSGLESMLGKIAFDQLELLEYLGSGSQGRVRKVRNKTTGDVLALKSVAFSSDIEPLRKTLVQELEHTTAIKHPNVVSSYEAYFRNGNMYFLMEYMDCGTCSDLIRRHRGGITDIGVSYIAHHVVTGMAHLHESGVVHRDVKPANLLIDSLGNVKISDFGVAGDARNQLHQTNIGSTPYMSPERIKSMPYSHACDIWSIGIAIAEIALGTYPFGNVKTKIFDLCDIIASGNAQPRWAELAPGRVFSPELIHFVQQCMLPQERRPSAEELLPHPFLKMGKDIPPAQMGAFFKCKPSTALVQQMHTAAHNFVSQWQQTQQQQLPLAVASPNSTLANGAALSTMSNASSPHTTASSTTTAPGSTTMPIGGARALAQQQQQQQQQCGGGGGMMGSISSSVDGCGGLSVPSFANAAASPSSSTLNADGGSEELTFSYRYQLLLAEQQQQQQQQRNQQQTNQQQERQGSAE